MINSIKIIGLFLFLFFSVNFLYAPPGDPGGGPGGGDPPVGGTGVPLDGGSLLLLIAGVTYGAKTLREKRKKK